MLELEGRPGVSLAGRRRPVVRDSLPAVSIAGALSPWYVVRVPFALGARARGPGSAARGQLGIGYLLTSTPAGVRDPRAGIREPCSRSAGRGPGLEVPGAGPGSGRRVCHSVAVYVIPAGALCMFLCMSFRALYVCHFSIISGIFPAIISGLSRDNGPRCTAQRSRRNRAKLGPKNRPLCWLRGRMPNFRQPIGSQRERGYPGRKKAPG